MHRARISRREVVRTVLAVLGAYGVSRRRRLHAAPTPLALPLDAPLVKLDFGTKGIEDWTVVDGQWAVEDMPMAPAGKWALVQRATKNGFNVIVAPPGPYADVDASVCRARIARAGHGCVSATPGRTSRRPTATQT